MKINNKSYTLRLPADLISRLKPISIRTGVSVSGLVRLAIRIWLDNNDQK